jgi:hypothetical protein
MHKYLPWFAIFCSLIAGTFASELVSSLTIRKPDEIPPRATAPILRDLPAKVAMSSPQLGPSNSVNN